MPLNDVFSFRVIRACPEKQLALRISGYLDVMRAKPARWLINCFGSRWDKVEASSEGEVA